MVTWVSGQSSCTASAMTWAASWRISSSAAGSRAVTMARLTSRSMGWERSESRPSMVTAKAAFSSDFEMSAATCAPVTPAG